MPRQWDNIELLRAVDRLQKDAGGSELWSCTGWQLMEHLRGDRVSDHQEASGFLRELEIARDADLISYHEDRLPGGLPYSGSDPFQHLQRLRRFSLTVAGQDRARGQRVITPPPDPAQDDGRAIATSVLRDAARALSDEYDPAALRDFLLDAGIQLGRPPIAEVDIREPFAILQGLYDGGSDGRRILRSFLGQWLDGLLLDDPPEAVRRKLLERLVRQGWFVSAGTLVVGTPSRGPQVPSLVFLDARLTSLHPRVREAAQPYVRSNAGEAAVLEAMKVVNKRLQELTGSERDGQDLVNQALSNNKPVVFLADLTTETGRNIQQGYRSLLAGAMQALRNPRAHEPFAALDQDELFEQLGLASLLMRRLDTAEVLASAD